MASHHTQDDASHAHEGAAMDYAEHNKTFALFADLIKWGSVISLSLVVLTGILTGLIPFFIGFVLIVAMVVGAVKLF